jgi:SAM-dependent methyltransferase
MTSEGLAMTRPATTADPLAHAPLQPAETGYPTEDTDSLFGTGPAAAALPAPAVPLFENEGWCACCRGLTRFVAHDAWLRDYYLCAGCGSVPRQRHLQTVLDETLSGWHDLTVHESSPSNDFLSRWCSDYSTSQYFPDVPRGQVHEGVRSEDVEALTFADESIDVFITQDVLEHVFRPDRAIAEIHRVLRPGGAHVFTAPKHRGLDETRQRARLTEDGVEHLLPEEYHGNPIGDNKALVTWDYGYDFEALMSQWAGASVEAHHRRDRSRGLDAAFNEVFVIRKPGPRPTAPAAETPGRDAAGRLRTVAGRVRRAARALNGR